MPELSQYIQDALSAWGLPRTGAFVSDTCSLVLLLLLAYLCELFFRHAVLKAVLRFVKHTKAKWDEAIFNRQVMLALSRVIIPLVTYLFAPWAFAGHGRFIEVFVQRISLLCIILTVLAFALSLLQAFYNFYNNAESLKGRPLKILLQTLQVTLWIVAIVVTLSLLLNQDPLSLLAGLGASAAILMLIFKDTIMGLVSAAQLSYNEMLKVGDWITVPKYGANGLVLEVTLNTVKVRNWDNTITTVPPYALISDSFQNWSPMFASEGRRIKRSVNIDLCTIRFCTDEMLQRFSQLPWAAEYIEKKSAADPDQAGRITNLGIFRAYIEGYLMSLPYTNLNLFCVVRTLQPTDKGLPMELYFFSSEKHWIPYEKFQAEVFDFVLASVRRFDLRVFQSPTGADIRDALSQKAKDA